MPMQNGTWMKVHTNVIRHQKTYALASRLLCPRSQVVGMLLAMWAWAVDTQLEDGILRGPGVEDLLARELDVERWLASIGIRANDLLGHFAAAGWLDYIPGIGFKIHDWESHGGALLKRRAEERARSDKRRAESTARRREHAQLMRDRRGTKKSKVINLDDRRPDVTKS